MAKSQQEWANVVGVGAMYFYTCPDCGMWTGVPVATERLARARPGLSIYCANGHATSFSKGESEEDKLRRERDRLTQQIAQKDDEIAHQRAATNRAWERVAAEERRLRAAKGQITKIKKRASNGVCPCCNRTFADLARHMGTKHPGYVKEPTADELVTVN